MMSGLIVTQLMSKTQVSYRATSDYCRKSQRCKRRTHVRHKVGHAAVVSAVLDYDRNHIGLCGFTGGRDRRITVNPIQSRVNGSTGFIEVGLKRPHKTYTRINATVYVRCIR